MSVPHEEFGAERRRPASTVPALLTAAALGFLQQVYPPLRPDFDASRQGKPEHAPVAPLVQPVTPTVPPAYDPDELRIMQTQDGLTAHTPTGPQVSVRPLNRSSVQVTVRTPGLLGGSLATITDETCTTAQATDRDRWYGGGLVESAELTAPILGFRGAKPGPHSLEVLFVTSRGGEGMGGQDWLYTFRLDADGFATTARLKSREEAFARGMDARDRDPGVENVNEPLCVLE